MDHLPHFDGSGRRRLIAGTIVVLAAVVGIDELRDRAFTLIASNEVSFSVVLAAGLIVYVIGVVVELFGELIVVRAIANVVAAYELASAQVPSTSRRLLVLRRIAVAVYGTLLLIPFSVLTISGVNGWQLKLMSQLSSDGQEAFKRLPISTRNAIENPLEKKGEFGRKALLCQFRTAGSHRWARRMIEQPRNFLTIVSGITVGLAVLIATTPTIGTMSKATASRLNAVRADLNDSIGSLITTYYTMNPDPSFRSSLPWRDRIERAHKFENDTSYVTRGAFGFAAANYLFSDETAFTRDTKLLESMVKADLPAICDTKILWLQPGTLPNGQNLPSAESVLRTKCRELKFQLESFSWYRSNARAEIHKAQNEMNIFPIAGIAIAIFLYFAFFAILNASTVSLIEALALEPSPPS